MRRSSRRGEDGEIKGAVSVLIQKIPLVGTAFLYAPRGPVCDLHDKEVLADLKAGVDVLAKKYNAHTFKMDPDVLMSDTDFLAIAKSRALRSSTAPTGLRASRPGSTTGSISWGAPRRSCSRT